MPIYSFRCLSDSCGKIEDHLVKYGNTPTCRDCGNSTEKVWVGSMPNIIDDTINETIENLSATPQHFTSRSEKRIWLKSHGFEEHVRHVGLPGEGSDKSPHTSRWV